MKILIVLISLFLFSQNVEAAGNFVSGRDFINACKRHRNETLNQTLRQIQCYVYVTGVVDTYVLISQLTVLPEHIRSCLPKNGFGLKNIVELVIQNVKVKPSLLKLRPQDIILFSLVNKYPCDV